MIDQVRMLWISLRVLLTQISQIERMRKDEAGTVVEKVILTAIFAALAIAIGAIIVSKVTAKANSINLN